MEEFLSPALAFFRQWYWVPLALVYSGVIVTILAENRNPTKTLAWLLLIVFLPGVGLLIYFFFGRRFRKKILFRKKNKAEHEVFFRRWEKERPVFERRLEELEASLGDLAGIYRFLLNENVSAPIGNNKVSLLINGEQKFPAMMEAIAEARHHIHLEYYIYELDSVGQALIDLLIRKAGEGVEVRFLVDDFGSPRMVRQERLMREAGIHLIRFLPVRFTSLSDSNFRNHRKVAIIDGYTAFVGGINIAERYQNDRGNSPYWRDASVKIQGDSVILLQFQYWLTWHFSEGEPFKLTRQYLWQNQHPLGTSTISYALSDPGSPAPYNMEAILIAISRASKSIQICTPYYVPSEQISTALQVAAASGIRVELIMPMSSDSFIVHHASFSFLKPLLQRGVDVYLYKKGFMHAKTLVVDEKIAFVGTVNMDIRSYYINFEIAAVIYDQNLCLQLRDQFEMDKSHSQYVNMAYWKKRPLMKRALDSVCRLLAPLL